MTEHHLQLPGSVLDGLQDLVFRAASDGSLQHVNATCRTALGHAAGWGAGQSVADLIVAADIETYWAAAERLGETTATTGLTVRLQAADGTPIEAVGSLHHDAARTAAASGDVGTGGTGTGRQNTAGQNTAGVGSPVWGMFRVHRDARDIQGQVRHAQKLAVVGRLASSVAHDFNNLLTVTGGQCDFLMRRIAVGDPLRKHLDSIRQATDRSGVLAKQLLAFSRRQKTQAQTIDIDSVVAQIHGILRSLLGARIDLVTVPHAMGGRVRADPADIEQLVMNLAVNARDAMPEGGRFSIETTLIEATDEEDGRASAGKVVLTVRDTGIGMDDATLAHAFEAFFTTKGPGVGTGLGLATVRDIVSNGGGTIDVRSTVGEGTTFRICLPQESEPAHEVADHITGPVLLGEGETILVVEDEEMLRALLEEVLQDAGYSVISASNGLDALDKLSRRPSRIDLLVTDVMMPGMSGRELADTVLDQYPTTKLLFTSGYGQIAERQVKGRHEMPPLLLKPFTPSTLVRKVRELLDG